MNSIPTSSASALGVVKGEPAANGHGLPPPAARPRVAAARPPAGQQWWQLASAAARHWHWILLTAALGVAAGIYVGQKLWGATHTATARACARTTASAIASTGSSSIRTTTR